MSDVAAKYFWKARDILDGVEKDRAHLESAVAHAIADARRAALEEAASAVVGVLRRGALWHFVDPGSADKIIEATLIELRALADAGDAKGE